MSHQEIADVLGSSVGAVKANFFHALANLKRLLEGGT
jgi:DNA-directed RNA polymerase specialized sigma24 family protein